MPPAPPVTIATLPSRAAGTLPIPCRAAVRPLPAVPGLGTIPPRRLSPSEQHFTLARWRKYDPGNVNGASCLLRGVQSFDLQEVTVVGTMTNDNRQHGGARR